MRITINALPIIRGGGLTVVRGLAQGLREAAPGWNINALTRSERTKQSLEAAGVDLVERVLPRSRPAGVFLWQHFRLEAWLKRNRTELLISINHYARNVGVPQVVYHLNLLRFSKDFTAERVGDRVKDWLRDRSAQLALERAQANVFESRFLMEAAQTSTTRPIANPHVIYIGLPQKLIDLASEEFTPPQKPGSLCAITSPLEHKDNRTLLETLAELVRREPAVDWSLDIISDASTTWQTSRDLAHQLDVADRIRWRGYLTEDEVTETLRRSTCLIATSRLESFAMVALEAMTRGCPAVVADCAAMPESVGEAGLLAAPGSASEFADRVLELVNNPDLRRKLAARGQVWARRYQWSHCGDAFERVISGLSIGKTEAEQTD